MSAELFDAADLRVDRTRRPAQRQRREIQVVVLTQDDVDNGGHGTGRRPWGASHRTCRWCEERKAVGEFWRNPRSGWITQECRSCAEERERLWGEVEKNPIVRPNQKAPGRRYVVDPRSDPAMVCTRCGRTRPPTLFYTYLDGQSDRRYYRSRCKQCAGADLNDYKRRVGTSEAARLRDRDGRLRRKYGIGADDFDRILAEQGGRCAICRTDKPGGPTPTSAFHVDHDHASGCVRGLLCRACNTAIGLLGEDAERFAHAASYLKAAACRDYQPTGAAS